MARLHCIQHVFFEDIGCIGTWAGEKGFSVSRSLMYEAGPLPGIDEFDWLAIMGGPMSSYEERRYPWIPAEKKIIEKAIAAGKTVLGVCLGAQMIASVLGGRVYPHVHKEIGWFPVSLMPDARTLRALHGIAPEFMAFHWHGDTFDIPCGAVHIARSRGCPNQAFIFDNRVAALQFHCESTPAGIRDLVANCEKEIVPGPFVQRRDAILAGIGFCAQSNAVLRHLLDSLLGREALDPKKPQ